MKRLKALVRLGGKLQVAVVGHGGRDCWVSLLLVQAVVLDPMLCTVVLFSRVKTWTRFWCVSSMTYKSKTKVSAVVVKFKKLVWKLFCKGNLRTALRSTTFH